MARSRNIKPGFFVNEELAEIEPLGRILFAGLWTLADRSGRLEDRPKRIKTAILPYDDCDCDKLLTDLAAFGFITRYCVESIAYIQVVNWGKHQQPHVREATSTIPAPDKPCAGTGLISLNPESLILNPESLIPDQTAPSAAADQDGESEGDFVSFSKQFWEIYPARNGKKVGKVQADAALRRAAKRDYGSLLLAARNYAASSTVARGYARDPPRFLAAGYWREWIEPEREAEDDKNGKYNGKYNGKQEEVGPTDPGRLQREAARFERRRADKEAAMARSNARLAEGTGSDGLPAP